MTVIRQWHKIMTYGQKLGIDGSPEFVIFLQP